MKTIAYIDGFNLYHSILEFTDPELLWIDLWQLSDSFTRHDETLKAVHYFSAYNVRHPRSYRRHQKYVAGLEAVGVTTHMAHFKFRLRTCRNCGNTWQAPEEKETDVHIALRILEDAINHDFDTALIFSADSDLVPVLRAVNRLFPEKKIRIAVSNLRYKTARGIIADADGTHTIRKGRLRARLLSGKNPYAK